MAKKPKTSAALAAELLRKFPNQPIYRLAGRLYEENKERFRNREVARNALNRCAGRGNRSTARVAKENQVYIPMRRAGERPKCPESRTEEWKAIELPRPGKYLVIADTHIPYHDKKAIETAVEYGRKKHKPTGVILDGDANDFYNVSRWDKDPKRRDLKGELEDGKEFRGWLRSKFPNADILEKLGNHGERWDKWIWSKAVELWNVEAVQYHNILDFEKYGITRVDDQPILAGSLAILHGHELAKGLTSPVNHARGAFLKTLHTVLVAHGHRTSTHCEPDMFGREITTWSMGCLCELNPPYCRFPKWNWGFAVVEVSADGQFNVHNYRISSDYQVRSS